MHFGAEFRHEEGMVPDVCADIDEDGIAATAQQASKEEQVLLLVGTKEIYVPIDEAVQHAPVGKSEELALEFFARCLVGITVRSDEAIPDAEPQPVLPPDQPKQGIHRLGSFRERNLR
jgi:hypothetical protein